MIILLQVAVETLLSIFKTREKLILENLALRQQLAVLNRSTKRPQLTRADRMFWVLLSRFWSHWSETLLIVQPETVVRWHRQGFRRYWAWKSRVQRLGRPSINPTVKELIRTMSQANPLWGSPRIHGELLKLDIHVSQATVSKYMIRNRKPPSPSWRTFLHNHLPDLASIDFFTVPTATFRVLSVFIVLSHARRAVLHFNITEHPTAQWTPQQIIEAFPFVIVMVSTAVNFGAGWPGRGSNRCALKKDAPEGRVQESAEIGKIRALPVVGGLRHNALMLM